MKRTFIHILLLSNNSTYDSVYQINFDKFIKASSKSLPTHVHFGIYWALHPPIYWFVPRWQPRLFFQRRAVTVYIGPSTPSRTFPIQRTRFLYLRIPLEVRTLFKCRCLRQRTRVDLYGQTTWKILGKRRSENIVE